MQNCRNNHKWTLRIAGLTGIFVIFLFSNVYAYTLTGQVTGPTGPIEGFDVFFDCCATEWRVSTDKDGFYSFTTEGAQTSASIIVVPPLESKLAQSTRLLDINDMSGIDFHLVRRNLLAGRVVNQNGYPVNLDHDLYNSQGAKHLLNFNDFAEFLVYLPPGEYTLRIYKSNKDQADHAVNLPAGEVFYWEVTNDVSDEALPLPPDRDPVQQLPPLIDKINVGAPGSIMPGVSFLEIINLHTGNFTIVPVLANGSFEADILAPYGSALLIRLSRFNRYNRYSGTSTILWVFPPDMGLESGTIPVYLAGDAGSYEGHWSSTIADLTQRTRLRLI